MNFDNLVEDAEKHGAIQPHNNSNIVISEQELQALITQYILADRAQGQEPVGWQVKHYAADWITITSKEVAEHENKVTGALIRPVFTHAQPTPAQIVDAQIDVLRKAARHLLARISLSYDDILSHAESTNYDDVRLAASDTESDACANALLDLVDKLRKGEPL